MTPIGPRGSYAISAEEKKNKMIQKKNKEHTFEAISDLQKESTRIAIQKKKTFKNFRWAKTITLLSNVL